MKLKSGLALLAAMGVFFLFAPLYAKSPSDVGSKIPNFKLKNLEDESVKLHDVIRDKTAVVNFTTPWCQDCKKLKEILDTIIPQYQEKGVAFCFIYIGKKKKGISEGDGNGDKNKGAVKLLDEKRAATMKMKISKIPHLFIVDEKGIIRFEGLILEEEKIVEEIERVVMSQ